MDRRTKDLPFDIRDRRAMVSLGPLNETQYCTYMCPFCYVQAGFLSYRNLSIPQILNWLEKHKTEFDIIYISGDTDSFAPPRTKVALELLETLLQLRKDVLFTTRAVLGEEDMNKLSDIAKKYNEEKLMLFGCVSITSWTTKGIEPANVPLPEKRVEELRKFKDMGIIPILAMRPFIPIVPISDYQLILEKTLGLVEVVLGESWYVDCEEILERRTLKNCKLEEFTLCEMPFDNNKKVWKRYDGIEQKNYCEEWCKRHNVLFFMRSLPAIKKLKERQGK
ncbi:MAG: hypothetical protein HDQ98_12220 [Lachnospiraceae bacterium]|nr:hypothetical protein [Lachnospiraceae bacterium]